MTSFFRNLTLSYRGSVRSTRGLGPNMTTRGQSIGISIGMLPQTLITSITVQKASKYYTTEFDLEEGFLNGACISISNLPENIARQTHRPEARGPFKSGAWGGRPTCHPQRPPLLSYVLVASSDSACIFGTGLRNLPVLLPSLFVAAR